MIIDFLKKYKDYIISILLTLTFIYATSMITSGNMDSYDNIVRPPLSPPAVVFPIVWTILYVLMAIAVAMVFRSNGPKREFALLLYVAQLIVNAFWTTIFFGLEAYLFAFLWLLMLTAMVLLMIYLFYKIAPVAAYLLVPYFLWLFFAGYLNLAIWLLNR